jgi:hypothetical protein
VRYVLIAALFSAVRILALGATIGGLYGRWAIVRASVRPSPELQRELPS